MAKTLLAAALIDAGIAPADERLAEAADRALFTTNGNFTNAMETLSAAVSADPALCWEAFKDYRQRALGDILRKALERENSARRKDALRTGGSIQGLESSAVTRHPSDFNPGGAGQAIRGTHYAHASAGREAGRGGQPVHGTHNLRASPPAGIAAVARVAQRTIRDTLTFDGKPCRQMTQSGFQDYARRKGAKAWAANALAKIMPPMGTVEEAGIGDNDVEAIWLCARQLNSVEIRP